MAKKCQVTGRRPSVGMTYTIRGIAKKKKGIGLNIVGKDSRRFLPNVRKKRFWLSEEKRFITLNSPQLLCERLINGDLEP